MLPSIWSIFYLKNSNGLPRGLLMISILLQMNLWMAGKQSTRLTDWTAMFSPYLLSFLCSLTKWHSRLNFFWWPYPIHNYNYYLVVYCWSSFLFCILHKKLAVLSTTRWDSFCSQISLKEIDLQALNTFNLLSHIVWTIIIVENRWFMMGKLIESGVVGFFLLFCSVKHK